MKKLIIILLFLFTISCKEKNHDELYFNEKFKIVKTNESSAITNDKFHEPIFVKKWLIQRLSDTTMYAELSNYDDYYFKITNTLWYNKNIGDTLYFEYIRKDRFFKIYNK